MHVLFDDAYSNTDAKGKCFSRQGLYEALDAEDVTGFVFAAQEKAVLLVFRVLVTA